MIRELYEETGIRVEKLEFIKTYFLRHPDRDYIYHKYRYVFHEQPKVVLRPQEHSQFAWLTPQEALEKSMFL